MKVKLTWTSKNLGLTMGMIYDVVDDREYVNILTRKSEHRKEYLMVLLCGSVISMWRYYDEGFDVHYIGSCACGQRM